MIEFPRSRHKRERLLAEALRARRTLSFLFPPWSSTLVGSAAYSIEAALRQLDSPPRIAPPASEVELASLMRGGQGAHGYPRVSPIANAAHSPISKTVDAA